jgi:prepilin-type N-terminal cleavage/methylation domain-containing protein
VKRTEGLTLIEVIVALAILLIALAALTFTLMGYLRQNLSAGKRTQAAQILNYLGRRLTASDPAVLLAPNQERSWDYGALKNQFPDIASSRDISNPNLYKATVSNLGQPSWASSTGIALDHYRIKVCWRAGGQEACVRGDTLAYPAASGTIPPPLPGIN